MQKKLKVLDLFSGIGGFALGLDSTGIFETVKFVEKDKYCKKVLEKNFPNIPIEEDIKDVKGKEGDADVIVGGFPCQPMSVAGKRKGTGDDRYLWPEMFRLIREIKPQFVIGENVQGIINIQDGMVLRQVQDDLESEGFEVQCFLIPASGIGAWHQRYRVWIVGHSEHNGSLTSKIERRNTETATGTQEGTNTTGEPERASGSRNNEDVSNTNSNGEKWNKPEDREGGRIEQGSKDDVSDTTEVGSFTQSIRNTRSMGEESKTKKRREGNQSSVRTSSRSAEGREREENVSDTEIVRTGEPRNIDQEKGNQSSSSTQSNSSSQNVSNTDSGMRRGWRTIGQSGEDKVWRFYSEEEEQTRVDIRSETIGRDVVSGEETNALQSDDERREERNVSDQSKEQDISSGGHDKDGQEQTWWQIESNIRGVPNGISYELDKDRANRIKTLGNAIVPQIARELGLAIKKVLYDNTDI
jgi:DNA-cytosine methyltransferase